MPLFGVDPPAAMLWPFAPDGCIAARLRCLPISFAAPSNPILRGPGPWPVSLPHRLISLPRAAALVAIGKSQSKTARFYRRNGAPADRLCRLPHFVDNQFFARNPVQRAAFAPIPEKSLRNQCKFLGRLLLSFCLAQHSQEKEAPSRSSPFPGGASNREQGRQARIHVAVSCGCQVNDDKFDNMLKTMNLGDELCGFSTNLKSLSLCIADALSSHQTLVNHAGLVVNEAMACGLPAIVSAINSLRVARKLSCSMSTQRSTLPHLADILMHSQAPMHRAQPRIEKGDADGQRPPRQSPGHEIYNVQRVNSMHHTGLLLPGDWQPV